jgi:hypothetical protein
MKNPEKDVKYLQLLRRHRIAGLIAATIKVQPAWTEALKNLAAQRIPVVVLGSSRPSEKVVQITIDDVEGFHFFHQRFIPPSLPVIPPKEYARLPRQIFAVAPSVLKSTGHAKMLDLEDD